MWAFGPLWKLPVIKQLPAWWSSPGIGFGRPKRLISDIEFIDIFIRFEKIAHIAARNGVLRGSNELFKTLYLGARRWKETQKARRSD